jgi:nucleoid-associated protein YgaU
MVPEGGKALVTKDDIQKELEWMRKTQKSEAKEPEEEVNDLQEELDRMRKQAKADEKKPMAEPEQASPAQREATDKPHAELDELHKGEMEPVEQREPEAKDVEQPEEDKEPAPAEDKEVRFYVVKRGDSLSKISKEVYGLPGDGGRSMKPTAI